MRFLGDCCLYMYDIKEGMHVLLDPNSNGSAPVLCRIYATDI